MSVYVHLCSQQVAVWHTLHVLMLLQLVVGIPVVAEYNYSSIRQLFSAAISRNPEQLCLTCNLARYEACTERDVDRLWGLLAE